MVVHTAYAACNNCVYVANFIYSQKKQRMKLLLTTLLATAFYLGCQAQKAPTPTIDSLSHAIINHNVDQMLKAGAKMQSGSAMLLGGSILNAIGAAFVSYGVIRSNTPVNIVGGICLVTGTSVSIAGAVQLLKGSENLTKMRRLQPL